MKKIKIGLISCAALVLIMCVPCYARSTDDYLKEITEINEQAKNVTIQVNVPEDFDQRVDVYLNKEAHGITAGDGYSCGRRYLCDSCDFAQGCDGAVCGNRPGSSECPH